MALSYNLSGKMAEITKEMRREITSNETNGSTLFCTKMTSIVQSRCERLSHSVSSNKDTLLNKFKFIDNLLAFLKNYFYIIIYFDIY